MKNPRDEEKNAKKEETSVHHKDAVRLTKEDLRSASGGLDPHPCPKCGAFDVSYYRKNGILYNYCPFCRCSYEY